MSNHKSYSQHLSSNSIIEANKQQIIKRNLHHSTNRRKHWKGTSQHHSLKQNPCFIGLWIDMHDTWGKGKGKGLSSSWEYNLTAYIGRKNVYFLDLIPWSVCHRVLRQKPPHCTMTYTSLSLPKLKYLWWGNFIEFLLFSQNLDFVH